MKEETPNKISWTNPSIGVTNNSSLNDKLNESNKIINELQNEVKVLQDKITKLTKEEIPTVSTKKEEVSMDLPFSSPFIEATSNEPEKKNEDAVQSILESVKEEVKEEPKEEKTDMPTFSELMEAESKEDRLSIVVNRYNTDIEAITKGKGAKFISLSETEQTKLQTGKIN